MDMPAVALPKPLEVSKTRSLMANILMTL
jgi:hypothetical protein